MWEIVVFLKSFKTRELRVRVSTYRNHWGKYFLSHTKHTNFFGKKPSLWIF